MNIHCGECGEELFGAVNRCWKCGRTFALPPEAETLQPPVRRPAITLSDARQELVVAQPPRSPFAADGEPHESVQRMVEGSDDWQARFSSLAPHDTVWTVGAAYGSVPLGAVGLVAGWFYWTTLFVAVAGLGLGVYGLRSSKRDAAVTGIVLNILVLLLSALHAAYLIWSIYNARSLIDGLGR